MLSFKKGKSPFKPWTIARSLLEPRSIPNDANIYEHMPYVAAISDSIISTRDGELIGSLLIHGYPVETAEDGTLETQTATFAKIIDGVDSTASFYVNKVITYRGTEIDCMTGNGFADHVDQMWSEGFDEAPPMTRYSILTVGVRKSTTDGIVDLFTGGGSEEAGARARLAETLNLILDEFVRQFKSAGVKRLTLSSGEWLGYLASINTAEYHPIYPLGNGMPIGAQISETDILFKTSQFQTSGMVEAEHTLGAVLSLTKYPNATEPGIYDNLDIPHKLVVTHSYMPVPLNIALAKVDVILKQMKSVKSAAESLQNELPQALDDLSSGRLSLGNHHCSVVIHAQNRDDLENVISLVKRAGNMNGGTIQRENISMRSVFFAQHPGNQAYRAREAIITNQNFADMVAFHNRPAGKITGIPWGAPVTHFRTASDDLYAFNFHLGQTSPNELTAGHTLILGQTGTGKSVLAAFLMTQAQRFGTRVFCFDKDRGLEIPLRANGVDYISVQMGSPTGLNPFASEVDDRGVAWVSSFIESLVSYGGEHQQLSSEQRNAIANAARENARAFADGDDLNTFAHFTSFFAALDDGYDLEERFKEWTEGRFGWLFDGKGADPLADPSKSVAFDLTELFDNSIVRTAWLGYVLRRIERIVEDGRPTLIVMDEAWQLLDDPVFAKAIKAWLLIMRKQNAVVMMLTQLPEHITQSAAGDAITGGVSTKIVFLDPKNNPEHYRPLGFSDGELAMLKPEIKTRSVLCVSDQDSILLDVNLSSLGPALNIIAGGKSLRTTLPPGWEDTPEFWKGLL